MQTGLIRGPVTAMRYYSSIDIFSLDFKRFTLILILVSMYRLRIFLSPYAVVPHVPIECAKEFFDLPEQKLSRKHIRNTCIRLYSIPCVSLLIGKL